MPRAQAQRQNDGENRSAQPKGSSISQPNIAIANQARPARLACHLPFRHQMARTARRQDSKGAREFEGQELCFHSHGKFFQTIMLTFLNAETSGVGGQKSYEFISGVKKERFYRANEGREVDRTKT
jgi:hypothetical protein